MVPKRAATNLPGTIKVLPVLGLLKNYAGNVKKALKKALQLVKDAFPYFGPLFTGRKARHHSMLRPKSAKK